MSVYEPETPVNLQALLRDFECSDSEEDSDASYDPDAESSDSDADELFFSDPELWPPALNELLVGSLASGDPSSQTGLLAGVAPMLLHRAPHGHPERPARIVSIYHELLEQGLVARSKLVPARLASMDDIRLVHGRRHAARACATYESDIAASASLNLLADSDTYFDGSASGEAARMSVGCVVELATRVVQGELANALAVVRPPGHHCEERQAMGFCLINNVPVAIAAVRERLGVGKVLIVDWDVHHGNGVQHLFDADPTTLYVSLHRFGEGFYPGTGAPTEVGEGAGVGYSANVAWRTAGLGDAEYAAAFEALVMPLARAFAPELVLVCAGFDAAAGDPLGGMELSPAGYAHMTAELSRLAGGKLVVALEGGYNLRSIARSAAAVLRVLLGEAPPPLAARPPSFRALLDIQTTVDALAPYWRRALGASATHIVDGPRRARAAPKRRVKRRLAHRLLLTTWRSLLPFVGRRVRWRHRAFGLV
jgi:histone deacetylase 6